MHYKYKISCTELKDSLEAGEYLGICINCGYVQDKFDPATSSYECGNCGKLCIYGVEEILTLGWCV